MEERVPLGIQANSSDSQQGTSQEPIPREERTQTLETTEQPAINGDQQPLMTTYGGNKQTQPQRP